MDSSRRQLIDNIRIAIAEHSAPTEVFSTAVELIDSFSEHYHWTGFYIMRDNALEVGPYKGPRTEHVRIELDRGICGAAATRKQTVIVDNVKAAPEFIACSLSTRSEIVVPLMDGDEVLGEIDIDSDRPANFTQEDREMLEEVANVVVQRLREIR